jgi:cystathionine beta-synthase
VRKGYKLVLVIPDKMSREKVFHLKAMGVEVVMTRSDVGKGHPDYYQDIAEKIAAETGAFYVNQFGNERNTYAHETTTGPEIWEQMGHKLDAVVCGVGSAGTLAGLTRYFREVSPNTAMVLGDPAGSILVDLIKTGKHGDAGSWLIEGIGEDFVPPIADLTGVKEAYYVTDARASPRPASSSRRKASSGARRRGPCSPRRSSTAARARSPSAWSRSSRIAATSTSRRCTTTTGSPTRVFASARATATCAT